MPVTGQPLFAHWPAIADRIERAPGVALFLDFDGTLTWFQPRPEDVALPAATRRTLARLAAHPRVRVWVISGRNQADVRAKVRIAGVRCLGLHGWEGREAESIPEDTRRALEQLKPQLRDSLAELPRVWVEDKGAVIAVHYAYAAPADAARAREVVTAAVTPWNGRFRKVAGDRQVEVSPTQVQDKGAAARREWIAHGRTWLPIFVGDDVVDEPAFAALASGITVRVSPTAPTAAHYRVSNVRQVGAFLDRLWRASGASPRLAAPGLVPALAPPQSATP